MSGTAERILYLGGLTSKCQRHWLVGGSGEFSARKFWNLEGQKCIFAMYHWLLLLTDLLIYFNLFALMLCSFCFVFPSVSFLFLCFMGFLIIFNFYLILNFFFCAWNWGCFSTSGSAVPACSPFYIIILKILHFSTLFVYFCSFIFCMVKI